MTLLFATIRKALEDASYDVDTHDALTALDDLHAVNERLDREWGECAHRNRALRAVVAVQREAIRLADSWLANAETEATHGLTANGQLIDKWVSLARKALDAEGVSERDELPEGVDAASLSVTQGGIGRSTKEFAPLTSPVCEEPIMGVERPQGGRGTVPCGLPRGHTGEHRPRTLTATNDLLDAEEVSEPGGIAATGAVDLNRAHGPGSLTSPVDTIDEAEAFVSEAVKHHDWETRSDGEYGPLSYVERGTGEDWQRFLSVPIPYLDACKIEALLTSPVDTAPCPACEANPESRETCPDCDGTGVVR